MDWVENVPKDYAANLDYRVTIRRKARHDPGLRSAINLLCRENILYFFNAWMWLNEPRPELDPATGKEKPQVIPFITWDHQEPVIREIEKHLGFSDIGGNKSRGEGASWIGVGFLCRDYQFKENRNLGIVSKDLLTADNPEDPDSLMFKIDWALNKLPLWMTGVEGIDWKRSISMHTRRNLVLNNTIRAFAATGDVASGGRKTWMLAQPISSLVVTPTGWKRMGDIAVGDEVIGSDGKPCKVKIVHLHGDKEVFKVTFNDGQEVRCCEDHLWSVITTGNRHSKYERTSTRKSKWGDTPWNERFERRPLRDLMHDYEGRNGKWKKAKHHIPMTEPVHYDPVHLPLHPYLVGAWLGDGYIPDKGSMEYATDDEYILDRLSKMLPSGVVFVKERHQVYRASYTKVGLRNPMKEAFRELDMLRRGVDKKIPDVYLRGTPEQRLELIRGLMDTDGCCQGKIGHPSSWCEFCTISDHLKDGIVELVQSLGGYCKVSKHKTVCTYKGKRVRGKDAWKIGLALPTNMCPFSLPRKAEKYCDRSKYLPTRTIIDIRKDGHEECRCITVDAENHLYLTDGFVVTSNCDELSKYPKPDDYHAMASTQAVTNSRLIISTFKGAYGAYYDLMTQESSMVKVVLDWKDNPVRNRGLYKMQHGRPIAVDPINNPLPPDYIQLSPEIVNLFHRLKLRGYNLEKGLRSPWYDQECDRPGATPEMIAEEYDRDPSGSMTRIFGDQFNVVVNKTIRAPLIRGEFDYVKETLGTEKFKCGFDTVEHGQFDLWCPLDEKNRPPKDLYVVGCDVATGVGGSSTSNSVIEVVNLRTGEQVMEYATNIVEPQEFGALAQAVAYWFWQAYLIWEANGPGSAFNNAVVQYRYPDYYYREEVWSMADRRANKTKKHGTITPGFWTSTTTKEAIFQDVNFGVKAGDLVIRSTALRDEFGQYIRDRSNKNNSIHHVNSVAGDATHGDRVIAMCMAFHGMKKRPQPKEEEGDEKKEPESIPQNTMAYRLSLWEQEKANSETDWNERLPGQLMGYARLGQFVDMW